MVLKMLSYVSSNYLLLTSNDSQKSPHCCRIWETAFSFQSPRNTYQCAMGKQAIGAVALNQQIRFDTLQHQMVYPQKPLVQSKTIQMMHFDEVSSSRLLRMIPRRVRYFSSIHLGLYLLTVFIREKISNF